MYSTFMVISRTLNLELSDDVIYRMSAGEHSCQIVIF
jgi:hypothetical protein